MSLALEVDDMNPKTEGILLMINNTFNLIYVAECILKLYAYRIKEFFQNNWNILDFIVAILGSFEVIVDIFFITNLSYKDSLTNLMIFFKLFRLIRLVKIIRMFKEI